MDALTIGVEKPGPSAKHRANLPWQASKRKAVLLALRPNTPQSQAEKTAARDAAQSDAFLREVDEALREDQFLTVVQRHGKKMALVVGTGLAALAGYLWWGHHQEALRAERSEQVIIAMDMLEAGKLDAAAAKLEPIATKDGEGSQSVARLLQAGIALQQGKKDKAAGLYGLVASDTAAPQAYRDLAVLRQVALGFDTMKPEEVVARIKPLAVPGNPWFGSAGELLGMAYLKQGRKELAAPLFGAIARDKDTPDSLRARMRQMAGLLGFDAIDDIAKPADEGTAPVAAPATAGQ